MVTLPDKLEGINHTPLTQLAPEPGLLPGGHVAGFTGASDPEAEGAGLPIDGVEGGAPEGEEDEIGAEAVGVAGDDGSGVVGTGVEGEEGGGVLGAGPMGE